MANEQPIIVIKKKVAGHGHHGGAWKVAYADFVTAMMALFIVLWLLSSTSKKEQEQIGGYFRDPKGTGSKHGTDKRDEQKDTPKKQDMAKLRLDLQHAIEQVDALNKLKKQIELTVTDEGLRIEMMENEKGTFFELGSSKPTPALMQLLQVLSVELGKLPNSISVEGHTDSHPYSTEANYGNWELSSDRANVARRLMQTNGIRPDQVSQVRGFANQHLRKPDSPFDASNRRVSLIVQYLPDHTRLGTVQDVAAMNQSTTPIGAAAASSDASAKSDSAKAEPVKSEPAGAEPAKAEPAKVEPAKAEGETAAPAAPAEAAKATPAIAKPAATKPASGLAALFSRFHAIKE